MSKRTPALPTAVLGGGCFWCLEAAYQEIEGVTKVVSGFSGGHVPNPTYLQTKTEDTGHAQVVELTFDPNVITYPDILDIFWAIHDPTTLNRQMYDVGPDYRSIILYNSPEQKAQAEASMKAVQKLWKNPIVTQLVPLEKFYPAEEYEQNYYRKHPDQAYCQIIINPKLAKLREKFAARLKQKPA
jgi:peptide-methionine (S)-S-oxide reductase